MELSSVASTRSVYYVVLTYGNHQEGLLNLRPVAIARYDSRNQEFVAVERLSTLGCGVVLGLLELV